MQEVNALIQRLRALFKERFHIEVPSIDTDLLDSGIVDSLQFVDLLLALEQEFGLKLSIETIELDDLRTLARLAVLLATHTGTTALPTVITVTDNRAFSADAASTHASASETPIKSARTFSRSVADVPQDAIATNLWRPARGAG